jgi:tripartite-type tricarboxylate transporter receptor subunit TctC
LQQEIAASLQTPDLKARLSAQGLNAVGSTPEAFARYIREEVEKWTRVVKASGARSD